MFTSLRFLSTCLLILCFVAPITYFPSTFTPDALATLSQQSKATKKKTTIPATKVTAKKKTTRAQPTVTKTAKGKTKKTKSLRRALAPGNNFKGAILYNTSSHTIAFERRADKLVPPASLTKILAMYTALDIMKSKKISPRTKVAVSAYAASKGGSSMGLHAGDVVTIDELFNGMAIASGNDAATALAEYFGKTESSFVALMNKKAQTLGMKKSTFKNASGLPAKGQFTTARDMLTLAKSYLQAYPGNLAKYHTFRTFTYKGHTGTSANPLLGTFKGADGLKTGFVNASGYNVIATSNRNGVRLIGVLLGAPTDKVRSSEITAIMEAGYGNKSVFASSNKAERKKLLSDNSKKDQYSRKKVSNN